MWEEMATAGTGDLLAEVGVDEKQTVDGAIEEELRILLDEVGAAEMADGEVEVAGLEQELLDAEHEAGEVAFAEFGHDDADGVGEPGSGACGRRRWGGTRTSWRR